MKKGRILLFNPWIYDFTAFDFWMKPLGLLYLGAHLRRKGFEVSLVDCLDRNDPDMPFSPAGSRRLRKYGCGGYFREPIPKPAAFAGIPRYFSRFGIPIKTLTKRLLALPPPDLVAISVGMTYWYPGAVTALRLLRQIWPRATVVLGGVYPALCPEHANSWGFDQIVTATNPVVVFRELSKILGVDLGVNNNQQYFSCPPDFSLYSRISYAVILTSLGCPFRCTYCASSRLYPHFWFREAEQVLEEIEYLYQAFQIKDFAFYDDAWLFQASSRVIPLLEKIIARGLKVRFHLPNGLHARYLTPQLAVLMKQSGFTTIRLSLETTSLSVQRKTGRKVDNSVFEQAVTYLKRAGFSSSQIEVYLLFGLPGLQKEDYFQSIRWVKEKGLTPRMALFSPIPGTPVFHESSLEVPEIETDPLFQNKIAFNYLRGYDKLYQEVQSFCRY